MRRPASSPWRYEVKLNYDLIAERCQGEHKTCQGKVEMASLWQSRDVAFCLGLLGQHVNLRLSVKRRRCVMKARMAPCCAKDEGGPFGVAL